VDVGAMFCYFKTVFTCSISAYFGEKTCSAKVFFRHNTEMTGLEFGPKWKLEVCEIYLHLANHSFLLFSLSFRVTFFLKEEKHF
jgi:hypothetical protein